MPRLSTLLGLLLVLLAAPSSLAATARGSRGVLATEHELSSRAGVEMLERGGNSVDAIVAAAFASGVVNPTSSGIGGGGFLVGRDGRNGETFTLDFRETAPAEAHRDLFVRSGKVDPALSLRGGLAVAVPGEVRGLAVALERWGSLPLSTVLAPAIRLAEEGFPVGAHLAKSLAARAEEIRERPALAAIYLDSKGHPWKAGETLHSRDLATTLHTIATAGPSAFYEGALARKIARATRQAGGVLTTADLGGFWPKSRRPLATRYRGNTVVSMGPPSSGGGVILEILNILEDFPPRKRGLTDLHRFVEASRLAFADRAVHYGDTDFVDVPLDRLLSTEYAAALRARIDPERASEVPQPPAAVERGGTSHLSAIDESGFAVALTTTINTAFGSMVMVPGTGIILNNQMNDFAAAPGVPNVYGLVGTEANSVAARKRPLSSMSPTIVLRDGKPLLAVGGSGGPLIVSATLQVLLHVLDAGLSLPEAVSAPRVHHQWQPPLLFVEAELDASLREGLAHLGHDLRESSSGLAAVQAVHATSEGFVGVSDDRKGGVPAAW